jgi:hypothetical protein
MLTLRSCTSRGIVFSLALLVVGAAGARTSEADPSDVAFDSVMPTMMKIEWRNPHYVNLGNDQFLLSTRQGVKLWDVTSNTVCGGDGQGHSDGRLP